LVGLHFKKDWLVTTGIARQMISTPIGSRVPTVNEYCDIFECSRGVVQNAMASLEGCGAISLSRCGKQGSFLAAKSEDLLFQNAGLPFLTGSMPTPLNMHLAGLATGICQAMNRCTVPFTFAFVQGGRNRADALCRQVYDFVLVTRSTAREYIAGNPDVEEAFPLPGCDYSPPYVLYLNRPGLTEVQDGMTVAVDPSSQDQWRLSKALCAGKDVRFVEMPFIPSRQAFFSGQVGCVVMRDDDSPYKALSGMIMPGMQLINPENISVVPLPAELTEDMQLPVVMVSKKNYGMSGILKSYLGGDLVSFIQKKVIEQQMAPQFF